VTREQRIVALGMAAGILLMLMSMSALYRALPAPEGLATLADRIGYALRFNAVAALPLLFAFAAVANNRFLTEAIDPTLHREDRATEINGRVLDNTLQQTMVFVIATMALAAGLAPAQLRIVPAATIVFVAARLLFWIGYRIDPLYRAPGMAATSWLNMALLGTAIWLAFGGSS